MASVTITLTDTPNGGVSVASSHVPGLGNRLSTAQAAALEIINRTCRDYGLPNPLRNGSPTMVSAEEKQAVQS
jgi:hypothetical protein